MSQPIMGKCPKCKARGYVTRYGSQETPPSARFGVLSPPRLILGLKTCPLCKGSKEVEVKDE